MGALLALVAGVIGLRRQVDDGSYGGERSWFSPRPPMSRIAGEMSVAMPPPSAPTAPVSSTDLVGEGQ